MWKLLSQLAATARPEHCGDVLRSEPTCSVREGRQQFGGWSADGGDLGCCTCQVAASELCRFFVLADVCLPVPCCECCLGPDVCLHAPRVARPLLSCFLPMARRSGRSLLLPPLLLRVSQCTRRNREDVLSLEPNPAVIKTKYLLHNKQSCRERG